MSKSRDAFPNSLTGVVNLCGGEGYDAFFSADWNHIKLHPLTKKCGDEIYRLSGMDGQGQADSSAQWLYGFADDNCSIAILRRTRPAVGFSSGIDMRVAHFYSPILVKSTAVGKAVDLSKFDIIEFRGGIMDCLHNPDQAAHWENHTIVFPNRDCYTKQFDVTINDESFQVMYSIDTAELSSELGKVPDLRNQVHSVLRFIFSSPKSITDIEKYYDYAMCLFQFCAGRRNVQSEIRLYKNDFGRSILVRLNDGFDDYADDLDLTKVIRLGYLGEHLPGLLKILNEREKKDKRPNLMFLPIRNKDVGNISYTNVTDLCSAFEREYSCLDVPIGEKTKIAAKELSKFLENTIDQLKDYPVIVIDKAKALLSQLKGFSPSLREKITYLYKLYCEDAKPITEQEDHDALGITTFYSADEFEEKIREFVKIRNTASHASVVWSEGMHIYNHLNLYIYFSVLNRAGVPSKDISWILSWMFNRLF